MKGSSHTGDPFEDRLKEQELEINDTIAERQLIGGENGGESFNNTLAGKGALF